MQLEVENLKEKISGARAQLLLHPDMHRLII